MKHGEQRRWKRATALARTLINKLSHECFSVKIKRALYYIFLPASTLIDRVIVPFLPQQLSNCISAHLSYIILSL